MKTLTAMDTTRHAAYCEYVRTVFTRADFSRWCAWGEWNEDYRAFTVLEGERVVANASVMRMDLLVEGEPLTGYQLGAVGCVPTHRGRGLARRAMEAALQHCGDAPVLLFANPTVRAFYPRFGFKPEDEAIFCAEESFAPAGPPAEALDVGDEGVRRQIHALCAEGAPLTRRFGARGYGRILTWYYAAGFARPLRRLGPDLLVVAGVEDETLYVDAILARGHLDLRPFIPRLIEAPIKRLRFGFTPDLWWPGAAAVGVDPDPDLFLRGFPRPLRGPHKFPILAQT